MTREQIEKAAGKYAAGEITKSRIERGKRAFMAGAQWRINAVWHDADEEPERKDEYTLVEYQEWGMDGSYYDVTEDLKRYKEKAYSNVVRWAYVSDLIPERKEEME